MSRLLFSALLLLLSFTSAAWSQGSIPFIAGAQIESGAGSMPDAQTGTGIVRVTPFIGAWLQGLGYAKLGGSAWNSSIVDSNGTNRGYSDRDVSLQLGVSLGGPGRPYLIGSYTYVSQLSDIGDVSWKELGLGLGTFFQLSPLSAITLEAEYRWVDSHYDPLNDLTISGTRVQLNMGFLVYFI